MDINLNRNILMNKNITSEGILAYVGLAICGINRLEIIPTNISMIEFSLKLTNKEKDRTIKEKIKRGLFNLLENNIIDIDFENIDFKANDGIVIRRKVKLSDDNLCVEHSYISTILKLNYGKLDNDKLLRYFIAILWSLNDRRVGDLSIRELADLSGISEWIVKTKYNNILEESNLIYTRKRNSGSVYGLLKDKEIIDNYFDETKYTIKSDKIDSLRKICRGSLEEWKNNSIKRCVITGSEENIEIHHSKSFQIILYEAINELEINLDEAEVYDLLKIQKLVVEKHKAVEPIPLTHSLHKELHRIYGHFVTTEETDEFIENKKKEIQNVA